jgi:hypothetical protein
MTPLSTPPDIVKLIVDWFFDNFKDPAHNAPHGYVFASDVKFTTAGYELRCTFGGLATERAIKRAVNIIEEDAGPEWDWVRCGSQMVEERP